MEVQWSDIITISVSFVVGGLAAFFTIYKIVTKSVTNQITQLRNDINTITNDIYHDVEENKEKIVKLQVNFARIETKLDERLKPLENLQYLNKILKYIKDNDKGKNDS